MKKTVYWFTTLMILLPIYSCNDILETNPKSFVGGSSYFNTESQIKLAVNGVYSDLQNLFNTGGFNYWAMTEMRSDNTSFQYNNADRGEHQTEFLDSFLSSPTGSDEENIWSQLYRGILHCNTVLNRINNVKFNDSSLKNQFIGETKFLRAFFYFNLVRLYGGVPLVLKEVQSPTEAFSDGRATKAKIYEQIISDASDAASKLPTGYSGSDIGRANKGAAYTMLGIIHLTQKDFSDAVSAFDHVININYSLVANYKDIFDPANKNNSESIFEIQYNSSIDGEASEYAYRFVPFNSGSDIIGFNDLRPNHAGYNIPTRDIIRAYEKGDKRKDASIVYYVKSENTQYDVAIGDSIPYIKKFVHPFEQPGRTNENWPVYRYAQVLLLTAEALNETGETAKAYSYINQVRNRAGLNNLSPGLGQGGFRKAVYHEERVELAFEDHRWFNLVRTGRAIDVMNRHGLEQKQLKSRLSPDTYNVQEYKLLYPLPEREIRLNNLEQNPGW